MAIRRVPADFPTIAAAIAAANPGDTVDIAGSYAGPKSATVSVDDLTFDAPAALTGVSLIFDSSVLTVKLTGGSSISVAGNGLANVITGNAGDNLLDGKAGQDHYYGSAGDDTYAGGGGTDKDIVDYSREASMGATHGVVVNQSAHIVRPGVATDTVLDGFGDVDSIVGIRNITGSNFADKIYGGGHGNVLTGLGGSDVILGYKGGDIISGGNGNDTLTGGAGFDKVSGGGGDDRFVFTRLSDGPVVQGAADSIMDFVQGHDTVDLSRIDADTTAGATGNQSFHFIGTAAFENAGDLRYAPANGASGIVIFGDVNGDGTADIKIRIANLDQITLDDFQL